MESLYLAFPLPCQKYLSTATELAQDKPVVVSKFILNAKEIEFDGVAQNGRILNYAISEHVEVGAPGDDRVWLRVIEPSQEGLQEMGRFCPARHPGLVLPGFASHALSKPPTILPSV